MGITRRYFHKLLGTVVSLPLITTCRNVAQTESSTITSGNLVLSTWNNRRANETAINSLKKNQDLLTAIEKGINTVEANPDDMSVGYGGRPDRDGNVTLDACIMDHNGHAGAVTYLKNYMHPISIARKVLEDTPHVILSGSGAAKFAEAQGYKSQDLMTDKSRKEYQKWLEKGLYSPKVNIERHDTIGMIASDRDNNMSGGCSTSGLSYKMAGRVGDSPIIGAGLYVDNDYGCATATGLGELVLESCTTFLIVELMRQGLSPQKACEEAISRVISKNSTKNIQVGVIAMDKNKNIGAFSIQKGFNFVKSIETETTLIEANSYYS